MSGLFNDSNWPRAGAWLAMGSEEPKLAVFGAPLNDSISPGRCDLAPAAIREALWRYSTYDLDSCNDVADLPCADYGDLDLQGFGTESAKTRISEMMGKALANAQLAIMIGGDNGVTRPGVLGLGLPLNKIGLIALDAHFDLRDTSDGLHNGNPIRALLDDGMPGENIVQIGLQSFANSRAYADVARDAKITTITASALRETGIKSAVHDSLIQLGKTVDAIYVDLDIDVVDRAFVPATPGSRPGGIMPHELRAAARICGAHPKVRAIDLVEVDPENDIESCTVLLAAAGILEIASGFMSRPQ